MCRIAIIHLKVVVVRKTTSANCKGTEETLKRIQELNWTELLTGFAIAVKSLLF